MYLQAVLSGTVSGLLGLESILRDAVGGLVGAFLVANIVFIMMVFAGPWARRKIMTAFADRIAVNRIGLFGLPIIVTDVVRLLSKELVVPEGVDCPTQDLALMIISFSALLGFAVILMGNGIQFADLETGLAFAFTAAPIASLGIVVTGYASDDKFSLIGALRAVVTNIVHEIPLAVTAASVVIFAGPLRMSGIAAVQAEPLLSIAGVTILTWFTFVNPFTFALFAITNLAEVGHNPFDISEAPTEVVTGYQTEYSSVYFVLIYLDELIHIFLGGAIAATLFLDGPADLVLPEFVWLTIKIWVFFLFIQWTRSVVPRLRVNQFLETDWEGTLILPFANLILTAIIVEAIM